MPEPEDIVAGMKVRKQ
jgi:U3 small nucleolar RNA-associated protein 15